MPLNTSGKGALTARAEVEKALKEKFAAMGQGYTDPRRSRYWEQAGRQIFDDGMALIGDHAVKQQGAYERATLDSQIDVHTKAAAATDDADEMDSQLAYVRQAVEARGVKDGLPPEAIKLKQDAAVSTAVEARALRLGIKDDQAAQAYVETNKDRLDPGTYIKLSQRFRPGVAKAEAHQYVMGVLGQPGASVSPAATGPTMDTLVSAITTQESSGRTGLTSPKGAQGVMQLMPDTAKAMAHKLGLPYDPQRVLHDREYNVALGTQYLRDMLARYDGNVTLAVTAYHSGPGNVDRWIAANGDPRKGGISDQEWAARIPASFPESKAYTPAVLGRLPGGAQPQGATTTEGLIAQLQKLDSSDLAPDVKDAARGELVQMAHITQQIQQEHQAERYADLEIQVNDGKATRGDVEAARTRGDISPGQSAVLIGQITEQQKARERETRDLTLYQRLSTMPGAVWNPYDADQRKAVEAAFRAKGGNLDALTSIWQQTGIVPPSAASRLRGALVSTDPVAVKQAANIAGNMLRKRPNAFAGVEGGEDIERAGLAFNEYTFRRGMSPDQAAQRIASENTPEYKRKAIVTDADLVEYRKQIRQVGPAAVEMALGGHFATPVQRGAANDTLTDLVLDNIRAGYDLPVASSMAVNQMRRMYAVNSHGNLQKYAPELAYPRIQGNHWYLYQDAWQTVKKATGADATDISFQPIAGKTDDDFRRGRLPRYRVIYQHTVNGQRVIDYLPGDWAADVSAAQKPVQEKRAAELEQIHSRWLRDAEEAAAAVPRSDYANPN